MVSWEDLGYHPARESGAEVCGKLLEAEQDKSVDSPQSLRKKHDSVRLISGL